MNDLEVRIVQLEPLHVASAHGFGKEPETIAWNKLLAWAKEKSLLQGPRKPRFFGFNNPNPSPGSPHYGYEVWMTVGPEVAEEGEIKIKTFGGGLYAVMRHGGVDDQIPVSWQKLHAWVERSPYSPARHQWLEEHFFDPLPDPVSTTLDLYMPIRK